MKINLKEKNTLVAMIVFLFILTNTIIIYQLDKVDRTILITDPHITKKGTLKETLSTEGEAEPSEVYKVFYEDRKGTLDEILVEEGQEVQAGTPLLNYIIENENDTVTELESANERLSVRIDKLNDDISMLRTEIEEYESLQTDDAEEEQPDLDNTRIIEYEIKNIEYEIKMIEMQIEENQAQIDTVNSADNQITVDSKINGIVVQRDEFSRTPEKPLLTIMNENSLLVNVLVGEDDIQRIKVDQEVSIKPKHLESKLINGKIVKISDIPSVEDKNKDKSFYNISIQPEEPGDSSDEIIENPLLIGSHVAADITLKELNDVVILPKKSLAGNNVVVLEKGRLKQKKVTAGLAVDDQVAVTKGLKEKQRILPKADSSIKGDTRYIKSVDFDYVNKEAYKRIGMEEKMWLLARGIIQ